MEELPLCTGRGAELGMEREQRRGGKVVTIPSAPCPELLERV